MVRFGMLGDKSKNELIRSQFIYVQCAGTIKAQIYILRFNSEYTRRRPIYVRRRASPTRYHPTGFDGGNDFRRTTISLCSVNNTGNFITIITYLLF